MSADILSSNILRKYYRESFLKILYKIEGAITLVTSRDLILILDLLNTSYFRERSLAVGSASLKLWDTRTDQLRLPDLVTLNLFDIEPGFAAGQNVVFLARSDDVTSVSKIIEVSKGLKSSIYIIWIPKDSNLASRSLQLAGLSKRVTIYEFGLGLIPLEDDLYSLELQSCFSDLYRHHDASPVYAMAQALMSIQTKYGLFRRIVGKGKYADQFASILLQLRKEKKELSELDTPALAFDFTPGTTIDSVVVIDRQADFLSSLMVQGTFEGAVDEVLGIRAQRIENTDSIEAEPEELRKYRVSKRKGLYSYLGDDSIITSSRKLQKLITDVEVVRKDISNRSSSGEDVNIEDLTLWTESLSLWNILTVDSSILTEVLGKIGVSNEAVSKVQSKLLSSHKFTAQVDQMLPLMGTIPVRTMLRALCLESVARGGLGNSHYEAVCAEVLRKYGYHHSLSLLALHEMGLLRPSAAPEATSYKTVYDPLKMYQEVDINTAPEKAGISYVYSGVAPLSVLLVQQALETPSLKEYVRAGQSSTGILDRLSNMLEPSKQRQVAISNMGGGPVVDHIQEGDPEATSMKESLRREEGEAEPESVALVVYLGGITRAEVAALRVVSRQLQKKRPPTRLVICTTSIITGNKVIESAFSEIPARFLNDRGTSVSGPVIRM